MIASLSSYSKKDYALAALVWGLAWTLMLGLDERLELVNLALLPVLAGALASIWLPAWLSMLSSLLAVLAFNWRFLPPRGSLEVALPHHGLLLGSMLALNWITAVLLARLSWQAAQARLHAQRAEQLRAFSEALRDATQPLAQAPMLQATLSTLLAGEVRLLLLKDALPPTNDASAAILLGPAPDADQLAGLWACLRQSSDFGPGTGRHEELACWYLPLRGRTRANGAVQLAIADPLAPDASLRRHAQTLCDQFGLALERLASERAAQRAHDEAESQATRNALLAAISHDYRTPLATILGAASALLEQDERLSAAQRRRLSATIIDETRQLSRLTDNTLQLARLDAPGVTLKLDWESAEEIVGAVLHRVRQRHAGSDAPPRLRARLEPGLPLLRCDALLLTQLLENLVDNALKYGGETGVELLVRCEQGDGSGPAQLVLAVRDRGPGVSPAWRERIFQVFQRGAELNRERPDGEQRRGAGVGLAACRAIARAHGGEMRYRARSHGGASFECWLPLLDTAQPALMEKE
ncbi:ATP-binding protein [Paucibacter sp. APW11]|uniref:histidine kinase n=1 Tax=Roseateles aquae TaxID=3077235 RepID=A0ABU3PHM8_9BURK|nr:ATP-binding protein [Paucibacter sp. APW11]MDT9002081.1 ATP-binding protein [Paucibacter sp. APW11]